MKVEFSISLLPLPVLILGRAKEAKLRYTLLIVVSKSPNTVLNPILHSTHCFLNSQFLVQYLLCYLPSINHHWSSNKLVLQYLPKTFPIPPISRSLSKYQHEWTIIPLFLYLPHSIYYYVRISTMPPSHHHFFLKK